VPLSYSITIDYNGAQWSHDALQCELCATIYRAEVTMELSVFPDVGKHITFRPVSAVRKVKLNLRI
jgi:hypothetical protein